MHTMSDYLDKMATQLRNWDADVRALSAMGVQAGEKAVAAAEANLQQLDSSRDAALKTFQQVSAAGEAAGQQMRAAMEDAWKTMQMALDKARSDLAPTSTQ